MKTFLRILVLGLLWCNVGIAKEKHDLLKKNIGIKKKDTTIQGWKFKANKHLKKRIKKGEFLYVYDVVEAKDGFPVRWGDTSQRYELRGLACTTEVGDCDRGDGASTARIETPVNDNFYMKPNSEYWITWSIYPPKDYVLIHRKTGLGQFHSNQGPMPSQWEFKLFNNSDQDGFQLWNSVSGGVEKRYDACFGSSNSLESMNEATGENHTHHWCEKQYWKYNLMSLKEFYSYRGLWIDFIINVKWGQKDNGHFKLWINGKQVVNHQGKTMHDSKEYGSRYKATFTYGMYNDNERGKLVTDAEFKKPIVIYWDEVWRKKSCKELELERLGYACDALDEGGKNKPDVIEDKVATIENETLSVSEESKEERYIKTLTDRISKKIIRKNSLSEDKATKVIQWVNKELVKWAKNDDGEIQTIKGRKEKMKSLIDKGIKKFQ